MNVNFESVIASAKSTLDIESKALIATSSKLNESFVGAVQHVLNGSGKVVVTGLGKSGHVGRKIAATLASTGTPSFFLHPAEALHGDLGVLQQQDTLLAIAFGGETEEVLAVAKHAKRMNVKIIAIAGKQNSTLAKLSDFFIDGAVEREVCPHNLAPTTSTTVAMALGDALAMSLMNTRHFSETDFAKFHPSGALGRRLSTVSDHMKHLGESLPTVRAETSFHEVLEAVTKKNYGVVPVLDRDDKILGIVSDGDIRRALLLQGSAVLQSNAAAIMTKNPRTIDVDSLAIEAFKKMEEAQITSLVVVDSKTSNQLVGLIRMHDLLAAKIV